MQYDAAIGMDRVIDLRHRAQRRDDDRRLVFHAHPQVVLQPLVRHVHDLVDREGGRRLVRVLGVVVGQFLGDLCQPLVELGFRPRVERRKRADDAALHCAVTSGDAR